MSPLAQTLDLAAEHLASVGYALASAPHTHVDDEPACRALVARLRALLDVLDDGLTVVRLVRLGHLCETHVESDVGAIACPDCARLRERNT